MRIPLHPGGLREMAVLTLLLAAPAAGLILWATGPGPAYAGAAGGLLLALWAAGLAFFRDPDRVGPADPHLLLAPADGRIVEIAPLDFEERIGGPAIRLSIFLSVFNVHVNRSPCAGNVRSVHYQPGEFLDARDPHAGHRNEANTIVIDPDPPLAGPIVVRQIAGLIARRIVCTVRPGDRLAAGQRIGLIKFGSRTELIVPAGGGCQPAVSVGQPVRGGLTVMARAATRSADADRRPPIPPAAGSAAPSVLQENPS